MGRRIAPLLLTAALLGSASTAAQPLDERYRDVAGQIFGAALTDEEGWEKLRYLTTHIGHRLSGSTGLERAIEWAVESMREEGLENVRAQPVTVTHWVRGEESLELHAPVRRRLAMLGLGNSVGTPPEGITAPVLVARSFDELEGLGREKVEGRIVLYAVPWTGYGGTVVYRALGASRAAALGARAALVRSATGRSLSTPHTGSLRYEEGTPRIPAAAVTVEDAEWLAALAEDGVEIEVTLRMGAHFLPDATSANVIAEIRGSERPEEVVVIGGHYDSWDVGQGAHDDGGPCIAAWHALTLLQRLELRPRRTLRVVLWTNEENGLAGAEAYHASVAGEIERHVAAVEMDMGIERPVGFGFGLAGIDPESGDPRYETGYARLLEIARLFAPLEADRIRRGGGGADIGPLMRSGVPGLSLDTVGEHYFDWHHSHADTLDKVEPRDFRKAVALFAVMGYVLADMEERLAPVEPSPLNP
jgi:hypothetical protein